ncbi:LytR C-terminal domain-containing protein [Streptomyces sp. NPDC050504]|uniref:LytR C-terminal domain-containing protein n=1 Tax=Streptomyces sp. NPDC050504 TaxID=3365618 RepID=UPI0037963561
MSMLTPPGMGGKYRITGDKYPRMRRPGNRRRIVLAVVAAVVALGLAGWGTLQLIDVFTGDGEKAEAAGRGTDCKAVAAAPVAKPKAVTLPGPGQISVNVYNATPRSGLAKSVADELKKRGFAVKTFGNAPAAYDKKVPGPGVLLGAPSAAKGPFAVLATQLKGAQQKTDARRTPDVDLILGTAYKALTPKKAADAELVALAHPKSAAGAGCAKK